MIFVEKKLFSRKTKQSGRKKEPTDKKMQTSSSKIKQGTLLGVPC